MVRSDIVGSLGMDDPLVMVAGFARDNLHLSVVSIDKMADKPRLARALVAGALREGGMAIVYCATRKNTESAAASLQRAGQKVIAYHGGMSDDARRVAQDAFQSGESCVMVATNAFGMGVDRPDVRLVIHWDFPGSLDAYYQEVGRAGRDGERAWGVMLFTYADQRIHEFFIDKGGEGLPPPVRVARADAERQKLKAITRWAYHEGCRHGALLRYFGDRPITCDLGDPTGSRCDRCAGSTGVPGFDGARVKGTTTSRGGARDEGPGFEPRALSEAEEVVVQKALSAVARGNGELDARSLARVLRGSRAADVVKGPLFATKSFGNLSELPEGTTRELLKALAATGCTQGKRPRLTPLGVEVMWRRATVRLPMPPFASATRKKKSGKGTDAATSEPEPDVDEGLMRALKERRMAVAQERGVPAFVVASNALLQRLAGLPADASLEAWLAVKGVGDNNVEPLREAFREVLEQGG
jgi:ATP-dependent DNA helicase RecQ